MQRLWRPLKAASTFVFMKIAEPRVVRVVQFGIYLCMILAGLFIIGSPPWSLREVLGEFLVLVMGLFILTGALLGAVAVLPGIWWLERAALIALGTGLSMYSVVIVTLGAPLIALLVGIAFVLSLVQRWMEIRRFQLAPKRG